MAQIVVTTHKSWCKKAWSKVDEDRYVPEYVPVYQKDRKIAIFVGDLEKMRKACNKCKHRLFQVAGGKSGRVSHR